MKKIFILVLMVLVGVSFVTASFADEARTIPMKTAVALGANTLAVAHGGTLYKITGRATSSNASYVVYDKSSIADAIGGGTNQLNIIAEGGEATQYDSFDTLDFGDEGLEFSSGLVVITTTCDVAMLYR